jgi:hypothetical protein
MKKIVLLALLFSSSLVPAQSWSGIIAPARAIDWGSAGLPASLPDGEMPPNPWTPPTRPACTSAQAGITVPVAAGTSTSTIATALSACASANPTGSYLLLAAGAFSMSSNFSVNAAYTTLRGSGPMSTILTQSGGTLSVGGNGSIGGGTLNASPSAGATSVTVTSASGATPVVHALAWFNQCDSGFSGSAQNTSGFNSCPTGSITDNGAVFVCGGSSVCNISGSGSGSGQQTSQKQVVVITSVTNNGGGSYTLGFAPGIYLPNWSTSNTAVLYWSSGTSGFGSGLEDLTIVSPTTALVGYASWIKGVRFVGGNGTALIVGNNTAGKNNLLANSYFFGAAPATMSGNGFQVVLWNDSDSLIINNLAENGLFLEGHGASTGDVIAYNFAQNVTANYVQSTDYQHDNFNSGVSFLLNEGNEMNWIDDDDTWGTGDLNTFFRNYDSCTDPPFIHSAGITGDGLSFDSFHRFDNAVANALGNTNGQQCTVYQGTSDGAIFRVNHGPGDTLTPTSLMRWANYDTVNNAVRCQSSEVPVTLSGNAVPFENSVPSTPAVCGGSGTIPASFFMNSATAHPSGGTGLSWWKVCTSWATFPTSCSGSTTNPFPAAGPDVTSGPHVNGFAYDNPAALAYYHLPVDTSYQNSYTITGSSWTSGTETLTVSGLPGNANDIIGPLQISGGSCATSGAGTATGAEVFMTGSTTTTIKYALASNPGSCTGTMLWPDVRQFDEKVFENDSTSGTGSTPPQLLLAGQ